LKNHSGVTSTFTKHLLGYTKISPHKKHPNMIYIYTYLSLIGNGKNSLVAQPVLLAWAHGYLQENLCKKSPPQAQSPSRLGSSLSPSRPNFVRRRSGQVGLSWGNQSVRTLPYKATCDHELDQRRLSKGSTSTTTRQSESAALSTNISLWTASLLQT
jgi:hypothetical protein